MTEGREAPGVVPQLTISNPNPLGDPTILCTDKIIKAGGLVLASPNGTYFVITVDDDGNLSAKPQAGN